MKRKQTEDWTSTLAGEAKYKVARTEAQLRADLTGFDHGLERNDLFKQFQIFMLPMKANRQGHETRCEVVSCQEITRIQKGHGP